MNIRELKRWASDVRPDLPTGKVIDVLVQNFRGKGTVYSPDDVARSADVDTAAALAALLMLADAPTFVLRGQWLYFDDDGEEFPLTTDEVTEALNSGEFFHPLSGTRIFSYRQSIGLVYEADTNLVRMLAAQQPSAVPTSA